MNLIVLTSVVISDDYTHLPSKNVVAKSDRLTSATCPLSKYTIYFQRALGSSMIVSFKTTPLDFFPFLIVESYLTQAHKSYLTQADVWIWFCLYKSENDMEKDTIIVQCQNRRSLFTDH